MGKIYVQQLLLIIFLMYFSGSARGQAIGDFQSHQTGSWNSLTTWERWNGAIWVTPVAAPPTSTDGAITILNGHNVDKDASPTISIDQVVIKSGGTLTWSSSTLNLANGAGDDLIIESGGLFVEPLSTLLGGSFPATVRVKSGGTIEAQNNNLISYATDATGKFIWEDGSIFYYNALAGSLNMYGFTYFPNVSTLEIPIFRVNNFSGINSSVSNCQINGVFEYINTTKYFDPNPTGTMTFRNGIRGTGNIKQKSLTTGQFIITGDPAELSGTGVISLQSSGLLISSGANVTMNSDKTINTENVTTNAMTVNGTLSCGLNNVLGAASFILSGGGTLKMGSPNGITTFPTASGNIQNTGVGGIRSFSKGANYVYNGITAQVGGNGIPDSVRSLTISNSTGLTLSNPALTDTASLGLTNGRIRTDASHTLKLAAGATVSSALNIYGDINEGNQNSFVSGPMIVETNNTSLITVPIGKDTSTGVFFAPVKITPFNNFLKTYTAEYAAVANPNVGNVDVGQLHHVSFVEFWDIACSATGTNKDAMVGLSWRPMSKVGDNIPADSASAWADLVVAHYYDDGGGSGIKWRMDGLNPTFTKRGGSNLSYGYITTDLNTGTFSPFTLGTKSAFNLLPLKLIQFTGNTGQHSNTLKWITAEEQQLLSYDVEKSSDGRNFAGFSTVAAKNGTGINSYTVVDDKPFDGYNYYRLKINGTNGNSYSPIIRLGVEKTRLALFPNPAKESSTVTHDAAVTGAYIFLYSLDAKKIFSVPVTVGTRQTLINTASLSSGVYVIEFRNGSDVVRKELIKN